MSTELELRRTQAQEKSRASSLSRRRSKNPAGGGASLQRVKIKKKEENRRAVARRRKRTERPTLARLRRKSSPGARRRRPAVDAGTQTTDRKNPSGISPRTRPGRRRQRRITAHEFETQSDRRRVSTKIETGPAAAVRASTETNQPTAACLRGKHGTGETKTQTRRRGTLARGEENRNGDGARKTATQGPSHSGGGARFGTRQP
jgi:hypothetical protein